ncbi:MAG: DUF768 domain-containing protein [Gallionella sp.]
MSKLFLRWTGTWVEENIHPGANSDIESHEVRAKRLTERLFAEAAAANFSNFDRGRAGAHCVPGSGRGLGQRRFRLRYLYAQVSTGAGE